MVEADPAGEEVAGLRRLGRVGWDWTRSWVGLLGLCLNGYEKEACRDERQAPKAIGEGIGDHEKRRRLSIFLQKLKRCEGDVFSGRTIFQSAGRYRRLE